MNCGAPLTGPYCASCGQQRPHSDLTLREFLRETTQELIHWDGKVPSTLKVLILKPGLLTVDFLAGRRARWLAPLRVYLTCSIAFFVSKTLVEALTHRAAREIAKITITKSDGSTTLTPEGREDLERGLPARFFGIERLERAAANGAQLNRAIYSAFPKAMFLLLPVFAWLTRLAWRRRLPQYPAHLYLALHLHAAWFGAFAVTTLAGAFFPSETADVILGLAGYGYVAWYGLVALRRVFGDSWTTTVAKAAAVLGAYLACFFPVSLAMLAYAVATM